MQTYIGKCDSFQKLYQSFFKIPKIRVLSAGQQGKHYPIHITKL